ncbi:hypothetical protein CXG81DRAFT_27959 [Caulochytrium protostelioides]|uniref:PCI domain-containing protein n=1 Tax=Caulochytrium protostelioides TaxID=1555241 RepID=A0A4P9X081_9FUNG|nr:hypothetical protein CXG81DRAFT_27959 [Caulochytrium protostelioides]|eukprot:RKO99279.1 hypothetical protein CXG81DRAFT_27959 [Caulochytrium protostelioides]
MAGGNRHAGGAARTPQAWCHHIADAVRRRRGDVLARLLDPAAPDTRAVAAACWREAAGVPRDAGAAPPDSATAEQLAAVDALIAQTAAAQGVPAGWTPVLQRLIPLVSADAATASRPTNARSLAAAATAAQRAAQLVQAFHAVFTSLERWALPVLYRVHGIQIAAATAADAAAHAAGEEAATASYREDAARALNRAFSLCVTDRFGALATSRKWGAYGVMSRLLRVYLALGQLALCRAVLRSLRAPDLPALDAYPLPDQAAFHYYLGLVHFCEESEGDAMRELMWVWRRLPPVCVAHRRAVLGYLIPLRLARGVAPTPRLLAYMTMPLSALTAGGADGVDGTGTVPRKHARGPADLTDTEIGAWAPQSVYAPFARTLATGDVYAFRAALAQHARALMAAGAFLAMERVELVVVRRLVALVWELRGKANRLPYAAVVLAWRVSAQLTAAAATATTPARDVLAELLMAPAAADAADVETALDAPPSAEQLASIECALSLLIARGWMKGYLAHDHRMAVLSQTNAFPPLEQ